MYKLTKAEQAFMERQLAAKRQAMVQIDRVVFHRHSQSAGASAHKDQLESRSHFAKKRDGR